MFASYARIRIRGSIVDELRRHDWSPRRRRDTSSNPTPPSDETRSEAEKEAVPPAPESLSIPPIRPRVAVMGFDDLPAGSSASLAQDGASPLDDVVTRREHEALHTAVEQLPERERAIIEMRYFQGMPCKAIAQTMGLSEARISQLHARATARLRDLLRGEAAGAKIAA